MVTWITIRVFIPDVVCAWNKECKALLWFLTMGFCSSTTAGAGYSEERVSSACPTARTMWVRESLSESVYLLALPQTLRVCCEGKKPMELSTCSVLAWNVIMQRYQESQVCCHGSVWVCTTVRYGNSDYILLMADLLSHTNCIPPCLEKHRLCVLSNFIGELVCWDTTLSTSHGLWSFIGEASIDLSSSPQHWNLSRRIWLSTRRWWQNCENSYLRRRKT